MTELSALIKRNCKLFFKDKGMFFTSLITPAILLVLYSTFLANIYRESFASALPQGVSVPDTLLWGCVGGQLASSLLAVSCVTVAFCSNLLMVNDKITGARRDLMVTPVRKSTLALSYYISTVISTLIVCLVAAGICFVYLANVGWYLSVTDVLLILLDELLLVLFGTALSSIVSYPLTTPGQASAVGTIVSSAYGFVCGAYMPIASFPEGLQKVLLFLPGTYGTSLLRNHALNGVYGEMSKQHFPEEVIEAIKDSIDCNLYFNGSKVSIDTMYLIVGGTVVLLILVYVFMNMLSKKK